MARERDGFLIRLVLFFSPLWLESPPFVEREEGPLVEPPPAVDPDPFAFLRIMAMMFCRGRRFERALLNLDLDDDGMAAVYLYNNIFVQLLSRLI